MLKIKYLHRRSRSEKSDAFWRTKKYWRIKNINLFSDLPFHQSIKKGYSNYDITPLYKFLESKIGQNWNDVYSEIVKKISKKYRHSIDKYMHSRCWGVLAFPIYDDDFIPRNSTGRILRNCLFVENDIIVRKEEQEIISDAKRYQRKEKLNQILENKDKEYNFEEDFDQKKYDEYLKMDGEMRMKKWGKN